MANKAARKLQKAAEAPRKVRNEELAKADALRAQSGAWGSHADPRFKRARTRLAQKALAIQSF